MPQEEERVLHEGRVTGHVILSSIVAATAGLISGYNIAVSVGVASMDSFLLYFFPAVYARKQSASESNYCKFSDPLLQTFTSSMYIAGLLATFVASQTTQKLGRKPTIIVAGCLYLGGVCLITFAWNVSMLMLGRVVLGCGSGFGSQAAPIYLSEIAPPRIRGALNIMFELNVTIGILIATLVNSVTANLDSWGWRLSFGIGLIPTVLSLVGSLFLVETPNSLIERGHLELGKKVLMKLRGTSNVDEEFKGLVRASEVAARVKHPFRNILRSRNLPPLIIGILIQIFQQLSGINAILYAPLLLETMGFKDNAALYSTAITGTINIIATVVTILVVDHFGRVPLLLAGGAQMFIAQVLIGAILGVGLKDTGDLPLTESIVVVLMICLFVIAYAYSWGCLGMLIPSETFSLEVRSAGQSIVVCVNLLFTFLMAQAFLSLLCAMKYGIFLLFAFIDFVMFTFVYFFVPETKGIRIDDADQLWKSHWFWKRVVSEGVDDNKEDATSPLVSGS